MSGRVITTDSENPNKLFEQCLSMAQEAKALAKAIVENRTNLRRAMYRMAATYQRLSRDHHNWLLAQAAARGGIDALLSEWFAPLSILGEDWRALLRDVSEGATEAEFMASSAGTYTRRKRVSFLANGDEEAPEERQDVFANAPPQERLQQLEAQNKWLREALRKQRARTTELREISALQEKRIKELESILYRIHGESQVIKVG